LKKATLREPLTFEEYIVAMIGGLGILTFMVGGTVIGLGTNKDIGSMMSIIGLTLIAISAVFWMIVVRPWEKFDDLQTPYFTGHHHEEHHHDEHAHEAHALSSEYAGVADTHTTHTPHVEIPVTEPPIIPPTPHIEIHVTEPPIMTEVETPQLEVAPISAEVSASAHADELTRIKGIGNKVAEALKAEGITTYAQIAQMTGENLTQIVKEKHHVRIVGDTSTWPVQAQYLLNHDEEGLKNYLSTLS
jgi:predicted flap endonuclease-1-like 5' DNA nuclease